MRSTMPAVRMGGNDFHPWEAITGAVAIPLVFPIPIHVAMLGTVLLIAAWE